MIKGTHMIKFKDVISYQMQENSDIFLFCLEKIKIYKVDAKYFETVRALSEGCCEECIDSNLIDFFLSNDLVISN
jgi:hypothetical protein